MKDILDFAHALGSMPAGGLVVGVVLAAFALAAFAIHAVLTIAKERLGK